MRLAIIGSRTFNDYEKLYNTISLIWGPPFLNPHIVATVISGGAAGADSLGEKWATYWGIEIERYLPDWKSFGKSAGFLRNQQIVDACDIVLAFWDGHSKGTEDTIARSRRARKITIIVYV